MTVDVALTIASKRAVDLWRISHDHGGGSPDNLRETALDLLTTEVERLRGMRCETCRKTMQYREGESLCCTNLPDNYDCGVFGNTCGAWEKRT